VVPNAAASPSFWIGAAEAGYRIEILKVSESGRAVQADRNGRSGGNGTRGLNAWAT
jgi:hypothetical protein